MARSKSIEETFSSASMMVSEQRLTTGSNHDSSVEKSEHSKQTSKTDSVSNFNKARGPVDYDGRPEHREPVLLEEERRNEWDVNIICTTTGGGGGGEDETSTSTSTVYSSNISHSPPLHTTASTTEPRSTQHVNMLPPILLKKHPQHHHQHEDKDDYEEGWRIRSRYLHCLGMDNELQHHDHPKPLRKATPSDCSASVDDSVPSWASPSSCSRSGSAVVLPANTTAVENNNNNDSLSLTALRPSPCTTVLLKEDCGRVDKALVKESKLGKIDNESGYSRVAPVYPIKGVIPKQKHGTTKTYSLTSKISFDPSVRVREIPSHHQYSERIKKSIWMLPREYVESVTKNAIEFMAEGYEPDRVLDESDFVERDGKMVHPVCELLDEPDNLVLKGVYYGIKPTMLKRKKADPKKKKNNRTPNDGEQGK
jgi:hypothetical protein